MADEKLPNFAITDAPGVAPKPRRGRPPGAKNKPTATAQTVNADVKQALATLDTSYNLIATGLLMLGLHKTMADWIESSDSLRRSNEDALRAAPKLARFIANAGSTGGSATFLITHGMAFATLAKTAQGELAERRANVSRETSPAETPNGATIL